MLLNLSTSKSHITTENRAKNFISLVRKMILCFLIHL